MSTDTAKSAKRAITEDEVRDLLADSIRDTGYDAGRPTVMSARAVATKLLGFDPTARQNTDPNFGGHTPDFYFNKHLSMTTLRRVLDSLVEQGIATKVNEPTYNSTKAERRVARLVHFPHKVKSGYVLAEHFENSTAAYEAEQRDQRRDKILADAERFIAEKYADEVEKIYEKDCAAAGLNPQRETRPGPEV